MKTLKEYLNEKLIVNKDYKSPYNYVPKTFEELRHIIEDRYKEEGSGTKSNPIDFNDIDVSKINSFTYDKKGIFEKIKFKYIDISEWNVSNVENMNTMFRDCKNLKSIGDLSNWNVSNVEYMWGMFSGCSELKSIGDISNWNVSKVIDMAYMFYNCKNLKLVGDLSNWNVSNVENIYAMFENCENLKSIGDISKWDVSKVNDMRNMFDDSAIKNIPSWYKRIF